jgi:hypothetical protein
MYAAATGDVPFDRGETCDESSSSEGYDEGGGGSSGAGSAGRDDWCPQLESRPPAVGSRRRLPSALAAAIGGCRQPGPGARSAIAELIPALDALLSQDRRHVPPPAAGRPTSGDRGPAGQSLPEGVT